MTDELSKEKRKGGIFIGYTRNFYGQNSILLYTLRARPSAPVAMLIDWEEVSHKNLTSAHDTLTSILDNDFSFKSSWDQFFKNPQNLTHVPQEMFKN